MVPIHIGEPQDFATTRELLVRANFSEPAIAARLGVPMLTQQMIEGSRESPGRPADTLHLLIRLFVLNSYVDEQAIGDHLSGTEIEALHRLGLIARTQDNSSWYSPVCLCPVYDVYTVSDRWKGPDGKPLEGIEDIVYPSVVPNTRQFLDLLPASRCEWLSTPNTRRDDILSSPRMSRRSPEAASATVTWSEKSPAVAI